MRTIFDRLKGTRYFTKFDLASGFHQIGIAEKDRDKTACRDANGLLYELTRAGFGLTVLPSAFTQRVKSALGCLEGVFSWLNGILIGDTNYEEHLPALVFVLNSLLAAGLPVKVAHGIFGSASHEFIGMIIDNTGLHPAPTELEAIASFPRPQTVEQLRPFLGLPGYWRRFVPNY